MLNILLKSCSPCISGIVMVCSNYALLQVFASEFPNNAGMPHIGKLLWSWVFSRVSIA